MALNDTPWSGAISDKLYLQSGQFTSTLKTSQSVTGIDTTPTGIETNDVDSRLGVGGSAIKTIDGLVKASVKTVNGLAIASVKTWNGLA